MTPEASQPSFTDRLMNASARLAAATWPLAGRLFRQRLEIDENRALWVDKTPGYRPVSYTHLDVYKRQDENCVFIGGSR